VQLLDRLDDLDLSFLYQHAHDLDDMFDAEFDLADIVFLEIRQDRLGTGEFRSVRGGIDGIGNVDLVRNVAPFGNLSRKALKTQRGQIRLS